MSNIIDHTNTCSATYYPGGTAYAVLVPKTILVLANGTWKECPKKTDLRSVLLADQATELAATTSIVMLLGLIFLFAIAYRSMNKIKWDFFRITALYIVGTLGVPLSVALGPKPAGFNRVEGFGILVHNFAEWFIVGSLWFGAGTKLWDRAGFLAVLSYVWIILTILSLLPDLSALFLILMIQGAGLDWTMAFSFFYAGIKLTKDSGKNQFFWIGFAAALTHILSIQPLFFGFALSLPALDGITIIFLVPTFMLYIMFSVQDSPMPGTVVGPDKTGYLATQREVLQQLVNVGSATEMVQRGGGDDADEKEPAGAPAAAVDLSRMGYDPKDPKTFLNMSGSVSGVISTGLLNRYQGQVPVFVGIVGAGLTTSLLNSLFVWFSPCMFGNQIPRIVGCIGS